MVLTRKLLTWRKLTRSMNFCFTFPMKLKRLLQVDFKLYQINANLKQVCKFSKGKNTRILVYNTTIVLFLTHQHSFQHHEINSIIDSIRIKSRFWILPYFLYSFRYTCCSKSVQYDLFAFIIFQINISHRLCFKED